MNARDEVLARVRAARGGPAPEVPRAYRSRGEHPDLPGLFAERLADYRATVHRSADVAAVVAGILPVGARVVVPAGLPRAWLPGSVTAVVDEHLPVAVLDEMDAVVTGAAVAIAETGTIVLDAAPDQGRRAITLVPDLHVCVVHADRVVGTVPEAIARLTPDRPLTFVSGPSATSDIELNRVEGVHGPRTLIVVLVGTGRSHLGGE
jgi:L-lactate dehydrogenase complex protein LldG